MSIRTARNAEIEFLSDVAEILESAKNGSDSEAVKQLSAIKSLCKWTEEQPGDVPASTEALRERFRSIGPAYCGVDKGHMNNVRSALLGALRSVGIVEERRHLQALSPTYAKIDERLTKYQRIQLSWLLQEATHQELEPDEVGPGLFDSYEEYLRNNTLRPSPGKIRRAAQDSWGDLVGPIGECRTPTQGPPSNSPKAETNDDDLNPEYLAEVRAFLDSQTSDDLLDDKREEPLRPATRYSYEVAMKRVGRTLEACGHSRSEVASLEYVTNPPRVEEVLRYILAQPNSPRFGAGNIAAVLATVAKTWVGRSEIEVATIRKFANKLRKGAGKGLSSRNRRRVVQFRDQTNLAKLFLLPRTAAERLKLRGPLTSEQAREMMLILVIYILTYCPIRLRTITELKFDHIVWSQPRMRGLLSLEITSDITKNHTAASYPLAQDVAEFMRLYLKHARPILTAPASPYLFPQSSPDKPFNASQLSKNVKDYIFGSTGLDVTPHIFRHIVHLVVLRRLPGAYALVARVCGHEDINTTLRNYATEDAAISMEFYQNLISDYVNGGPTVGQLQPNALVYGLNRWSL